MRYNGDYAESVRGSILSAITNLETCITDSTNITSIPSDFERIQDINNVITGISNIKLADINSEIESAIEEFEVTEKEAKEKAAELAKGSELARYEEAKGKARLDRLLEEKKQYIHEKYSNETKILLEELKAEAQYSHDGSMVGYNEAMNNGDVKRVEEIMDNLVNKGKYSTENKETVTYICQTRSEFPKYELTDDEIRGLAAVCFSEQGNRKGAMMEASLIANRFEEVWEGKCYEATGGEGLYTMVSIPDGKKGHWFACVEKYIDSGHLAQYTADEGQEPGPVTDEMIEAVRLVFEDGYRVLPKDVIEHDAWGEIKAYNGDTQVDREGCIQFETLIENDHDSKYIFYGWGDPNNPDRDPFGFMIGGTGTNDDIQEAIENIKNQPCFSYEEMGDYFNEEINDRVKPKQEE